MIPLSHRRVNLLSAIGFQNFEYTGNYDIF